MTDLLITSYKAQCSYVAKSLHDKIQREDFIWVTKLILQKAYSLSITPEKLREFLRTYQEFDSKNLAFDIYKETYDNLERRFEGYESTDPIERIL